MRLALLAALLLVGCDEEVTGGLEFIPAEQIPIAYKEAVCTFDVRCGLFPDQATCLAAQLDMTIALDPTVIAGIREGRIAYNGKFVDACFEAIADATCDLTDLNGRVTPTACRHFTRGLVGGGGRCFVDEECVSANCQGGNTETTCQLGVCVGDVAPNIEPQVYNKPCNPVGGCVETTYCNTEMNLCLMLQHEGLTCTKDDQCAFGLGCAGGICKPLPLLGEPCPDHVCRDAGVVCNFATTTETPICVQVGLTGDRCTGNPDCAPSFRCDPATLECVSLPSLGESCAFIGSCFDVGTFCDATGTCVEQKANGQPCTLADECAGGICNASVCSSPLVCQRPE
ncbi:MAG: hypothetical protein HOV81_05670 [Kofleriaceae bacterium]|nr:hypothetical protein [Kofleriaceae bacterium]